MGGYLKVQKWMVSLPFNSHATYEVSSIKQRNIVIYDFSLLIKGIKSVNQKTF